MELTLGVGDFKTTDKMRLLVNQVLDAGRLSYGPFCRQLERRFSDLHECAFGVLSNSGTSALHTAIGALKEIHGWQDGDEIIAPAVTFVATINTIIQNGLRPVLVDVDPIYYELDPDLIEAAITSRTRALLPVHLFGLPCDMTIIRALALRHRLSIIEDSCESMFVRHAGRPVGSFGEVGCFSFYVAHLLTTGVGGIALTDDPRIASVMRSLVNHGRDGIYISIDDDNGKRDRELSEIISRRFNFERLGYSYRITELEAALGVAQLDDWPDMIGQRQFNALWLNAHLSDLADEIQLPAIRPDTGHAFMMYPIVLKHTDQSELTQYLESNGIETRGMLPLINQPAYRGRWRPDDYPVAQWLERGGFYVGCHQGLTVADLDMISTTLHEYFRVKEPA
jgi:perosamine synthetase